MPPKNAGNADDALEKILADARQMREKRGNTYRERALKILPWICAWCGREFTSKKLHELTVHHKDRNHDHNPPDGSNWELLCLYCHDGEHSRSLDRDASSETALKEEQDAPATYHPFAELQKMVKNKK